MTTLIIHGVSYQETLASTKSERFKEVETVVGPSRLYRKGTGIELFADYGNRDHADLAMVALNYLPGVRAEIV
jgi:hypothetical protein